MKRPSSYLKMKVLGTIEHTKGKTIRDRIKKTSQLSFLDEEGNLRTFTWRTISTQYYRYKTNGVTGVTTKDRSDKGKARTISPEELLEAINQVLPLFMTNRHTKFDIYRMCIKKGWHSPWNMRVICGRPIPCSDPISKSREKWFRQNSLPLSMMPQGLSVMSSSLQVKILML